MKRYEWTVQPGQGMPVRRFLRLACPTMPDWAVRGAFRQRQVQVNGVRVPADHALHAGDQVVFYAEAAPAHIPVVYEDDAVLVCNKPAGVNSDRNAASPFSLIAWAEERANGAYSPMLCHRLDNQTSGLILIAKTRQAAAAVDDAMRNGRIVKTYTALAAGAPRPPQATAKAFLTKDAAHARVHVHPDGAPGAREIITEYATLETRGGLSLLRVTLHTGRTHQIRAHLAYLGCPVLGDDLYGNRQVNRQRKASRLCLCASGLDLGEMGAPLAHLSGRKLRVAAPFTLEQFAQEVP